MNSTPTAGADWRIQEFIGEAIGLVGGIAELARIAGVSERTVYAWKNGERHPSRTNLNRLTDYLEGMTDAAWVRQGRPGVPLAGLRERAAGESGEGTTWHLVPHTPATSPGNAAFVGRNAGRSHDVQGAGSVRHSERSPVADHSMLDEFVFVEKARARPSAGGGSLETGGERENVYAFRLDWVLRKTTDASHLKLMEVMGRSMENTLHNGDMCLVNERDRELVEDRVYVVRVHDEIYVKRFSRAPGRYLFRGDNRELAYQDIEVAVEEEFPNWEVIGRVIWAGKEF